MSHVDEGTLHAWLDGALDALPEAEAARVREHLATCEACAARLEEERAIRQEAADILGTAVPVPVEPPAFEEVRALARARAKTARAGMRISRLGWAASIVLALGAGWMLRDAATPDFGREGFVRDAARPAEEIAAERGDRSPAQTAALEAETDDAPTTGGAAPVDAEELEFRSAETSLDDATTAASGRGAPSPDATTTDEPDRDRAAPVVVPQPSRRSLPAPVRLRDEAIGAVALPTTRFDTLAFPRTAVEAKEAVAAAAAGPPDEVVRRTVPTEPSAPVPAKAAGQDAGRVRNAALSQADQRPAAAYRAEADAVSPSPGSLVVPGLEVLSVATMDAEGFPGGVRVRQLLAGGDTLELVHLPTGATPSMLQPVAPDLRTELVLPRAGGWLLVRAHATRDALLELVRRMDEGG